MKGVMYFSKVTGTNKDGKISIISKKTGMILVDGELVNPVPVSVARGMGAYFVIAVDLNHNIVGKKETEISTPDSNFELLEKKNGLLSGQRYKILEALNKRIEAVDFPALTQIRQWAAREPFPSIFEVLGIVATCQGEAKSNVLFLRETLVMGIERNLDRKISELFVKGSARVP